MTTTYWRHSPAARTRRLQGKKAQLLLRALAEAPDGMTAAELAAHAGVGRSYTKDLLNAAQQTDLVVAEITPHTPGRKGRPPLRYRTAPAPAGL